MTRFVSAVAPVACAGFAAAEDKFDAKKLEGKWAHPGRLEGRG